MDIKGAIFDLDGVIVDTVPLHFEAWRKLFLEYKKDFTFDDYKNKVDGMPRIDGARAILDDLSEEDLQLATEKKQNHFLQLLKEREIKVYQSSLNLIKELKENNIKTAVVSSSKNCLTILKKTNINDLFDVVIKNDDTERGKPFPDAFLLAAQRLELISSECLVFEDAKLGVEAAKNGNFKCIGVDRYNNPQILSKADLVVNDLSEINLKKIKKI